MSLTLRWLSFLIAIYHVAWSQWYWKELTHLYCLSVNLPCILCIGNIILAIWHCSAINWIIVKVNVCVLVCVWYSIIFASYSSTYYMIQKWYYTTHTHLHIHVNFNDYPIYSTTVPSVLWCCWLGYRKGIRPVKKLSGGVADIVICLERGADLHMAQLMPLPLTVSCFSKIQIGFTFISDTGSPG